MEQTEVRYASWLDEFIDSHEDLKKSLSEFDKNIRHTEQQQTARSIRGYGRK